MKKNIAIFGAGYVGYSMGLLLSTKNKVTFYEVSDTKIDNINSGTSIFSDQMYIEFLKANKLEASARHLNDLNLKACDYAVISLPTNFDENKNTFDTSIIESVIAKITKLNPHVPIIIKSTIPLGFTKSLQKKCSNEIIFSPEFLREGKALEDNLKPSRIIIGDTTPAAHEFGKMLREIALNNPEILFMQSTEAELVKLGVNTYLATRVAFFNELDNLGISEGIDMEKVISGISLDKRVGQFYNNPSFGYGGYCLPKDTKQLASSFKDIPAPLIKSLTDSNALRKDFLVNEILKRNPKTVGVYRLVMKKDSDNFRDSAVFRMIEKLNRSGVNIIIYEPTINQDSFIGYDVGKSFEDFAKFADIIICNRTDEKISKYSNKVFSRDIFNSDT
ncbi:MAG: nucleotide sugar dehydrogenase [SAR86 cluster bacterium]|nr:nucleotide sugar dehydrogenase [SAR86 cluster bacterium]